MVQTNAANERISLWWEPLELSAAGTLPPAPNSIGALNVASTAPYHIVLTWGYTSLTAVDNWEISWSPAASNNWQPWETFPNTGTYQASVLLTSSGAVDVRIRGRNSAGVGSYAQRTNAGVFTRQTVPQQTVRATGGVIVRSIEIS